jgi:amidase
MKAQLADAVETAEAIRGGDSSCSAEVEAALDRIDETNPALNAVIHRRDERARADAAALDAELTAGKEMPFRGVPIAIKDALVQQRGEPYHCGMSALKEREWIASHDSSLLTRIVRAGFVPVGRTNVPEWATCYTTEPTSYGATRNPWALGHSAGGSSGGSAAAVASGMVPIAHGNDMGGSIRLPAAYCGLVGMKPTRARTSLAPDFGEYWAMLTHEGVLTRTVRDTAHAIDALSGMEPGDPYTAPAWGMPLAAWLGRDPGPLRVGVRTLIPWQREEPDPECVDAVMVVARTLESLGHRVSLDPCSQLDGDVGEAFGRVFTTAVALDMDRWSRALGEELGEADIEPRNWALVEEGRRSTGVSYLAAVERLQNYARDVASWWAGGFDLLLTPTTPTPAPALGRMPARPTPQETAEMGEYCAPFNVTGQPAISVPAAWTADGRPVGIQLVAAYGREDLLIAVAAQLESERPWAKYPLSLDERGTVADVMDRPE